jgi:diguanylate cyclase (GGDEF)-like protein
MREQRGQGLPAIDDEYQGPYWWHLSRLSEVHRSAGMRRIAMLGVLVLSVATLTGILNVTQDWNALPLRVGPIEVPVTIYPPFVVSLLAAVWLGPTWGLVPAYTANLAGAVVSGLPPWIALLFALAGALEILIFWGSMVTLNISPDLRRPRDLWRFFLVCLIAPITASLAILLWNDARGLDTTGGLLIWRGWVIGDLLQALLIVAPILHFLGPRARSWVDRQFATPPRYEVTYTRAALLAAITFGLIAVLVFIGIWMLSESLELDPQARTRSGQLVAERVLEMQFYLGVLVASLTVAAGVFSTVLARMGERQRSLSRRESLTGCFNRRAFYELFPREVERARRLGHGVAIVFLDIDFFKGINDRFGHETGDRVLQQLSARLRGLIRETDLLFRWGGEEFVVLMPHTGPGEAPVLGERIRVAVSERPFVASESNRLVAVTVSVGVAFTSAWPVDPDELLAHADAACYQAKARGRNQVSTDAA